MVAGGRAFTSRFLKITHHLHLLLFHTTVGALMGPIGSCSVLGDFAVPLGVLERLLSTRPVAAALVRIPYWLPAPGDTGRGIEFRTVLGPAFGISAIPDISEDPITPKMIRKPDVAQQCFPSTDADHRANHRAAFSSVHAALGQLHSQLHRIIMSLLRNPDAKEATVDWLAAALRANAERAKMQPDLRKAATEGFMLNVAAVLLKLCDPFLDPLLGKAWGRLDARYVSDPAARGACVEDDTRLGATSEAVAVWAAADADGAGDGDGAAALQPRQYHFICEAFFLTASALRLSLGKTRENCQELVRTARHYAAAAPTVPGPRGEAMRRAAARYSGLVLCMECTLQQESLLNDVLAYYRLLAAYLIRLACPTAATGGPPTLPLPAPAPMEYASLPVSRGFMD